MAKNLLNLIDPEELIESILRLSDQTPQKVEIGNGRCYSVYRSPTVSLFQKENQKEKIREFLETLNKGGFKIVSEEKVQSEILQEKQEDYLRKEYPTCFLTEEQRESLALSFREKFKKEFEDLAALKEEVRRKRTQEEKACPTPIDGMLQDLRNHVYLSYAKSMQEYLNYCQETASAEELSEICTLINQRLNQLDSMSIEEIIQQSKAYQTALHERKERFKPTES